jgi:CP family cyanate transporter-like MFS transporter
VYLAALIGGAAATAAATAPLAGMLGWRIGLGLWALLTVAAAGVWAVVVRAPAVPAAPEGGTAVPAGQAEAVWRQPTAWAVAGFFAAQSTVYFTLTAWLPTLLVQDAGVDRGAAGAGLSTYQLLGIAGTLLVPSLAARLRRQRGLAVGIAAFSAVPLVGLLAAPSAWPLWTVLGGLAQGAGISLATTLIVLRTRATSTTRRLSAMAQAVAYGVASVGPVLTGAVYGSTRSWTPPLLVLLGVTTVMAAAGAMAGRQVTIDPEQARAPAR